MGNILERIVEHKREELHAARRTSGFAEIAAAARAAPAPRDFFAAVTARQPHRGVRVIAEFKRRSPSAGPLRTDGDASEIAKTYAACGAAALSVLTDAKFFGARDGDVARVRAACELPILRKDFLIEEYQVAEARVLGADAVLLIAAILTDEAMESLAVSATRFGLACLVEVHNEHELERAARVVPPATGDRWLLGINNRDLRSQTIDLSTTARLAARAPQNVPIIAESGIRTRADVESLAAAGATAVLIGETLLRAADIRQAFAKLFSPGE
ncbi:MAG: indole-3-glycerol phosphate synthase TrpC [Phycisphaerae bacterium]|nr:indole-3-glycerol phosphate synthase TrpC [Phycisphaerae bacterium]